MVERLTETRLKAVRDAAVKEGKDKEARDAQCPGLVYRVRKSGIPSWEIRWSPGKTYKHVRLAIGKDISLDDARTIARQFEKIAELHGPLGSHTVKEQFQTWLDKRRRLKAGLEPPNFKMRPPPPATISYRKAVEEFRDELLRTRRQRTAESYARALLHPALESLCEMGVSSISREAVASKVAKLHKQGKERQAEIIVVVMKSFWRFLGSDSMKSCTGVDRMTMRDLEKPERTLVETADEDAGLHVPDAREIGTIAKWLHTADIAQRDKLACLLTVYTVQRRRTVATARKTDFAPCEHGGVWSIPPASRKRASVSKRRGNQVGVRRIPLPHIAWSVVLEAMKISDTEWLFPGMRPRRKEAPVTCMDESTITHRFAEIPNCKASPHDMRRAFATTYRLAKKLTKKDCDLLLDHDDEGAAVSTIEHYAFDHGGVDVETWKVVEGWVDFVAECENL